MQCSGEEAEARRKMQKEAQKKLAEKMEAEKAQRLKELEDKKAGGYAEGRLQEEVSHELAENLF